MKNHASSTTVPVTKGGQMRLASWNETTAPHPQNTSASQLVATQAAATPDAVALVADGEVVTYRELNSRSNRLAHHLLSLGAGPGKLVALFFERSPDLIAGALSALTSGAAYIPLDPACPPGRLAFILNDSRAPVLMTKRSLAERLPDGNWKVVYLDADAGEVADYSENPPGAAANEGNLAYVIYTSGSTGRPKGVQINHESLLNLIFWHQHTFVVTPSDRATLQASPGFDASVWEMWPYLTAGASLHLPSEATRSDAEALRDWLLAQKITITFVSTAMAERLIHLPWPTHAALRLILTGGETLHHFPRPGLPFELVNNYGPTECTVVATSGAVPPSAQTDGRPSIGRPIDNTQVHVLDERLREAPVGTPGEIYIEGKGVARGYLNQPNLTDEKFIQSPFSSTPGSRLYKTGDLARFLPNGQIEFMGRIDDQVKIRGYRIEPNEIVSSLSRHPAVQASSVVAREDNPGDRRLVAYVVPMPGVRPTCSGLQDFLRAMLPDYMLPAVFVLLESLPLNSSGKVDRDKLPAPDVSNILRDVPYTPVRTKVQQRIASILCKLLAIDQIGTYDNFFLLGGHSLLGTQVIARIRDAFGVELSLRRLFEAPTVEELSAVVEHLLVAKPEATGEQLAQGKPNAIALQSSAGGERRA